MDFFTGQSQQVTIAYLAPACHGSDTRSCSIIKFNSTPTHITRRMSTAAVKLNDRTLSLWNNNSRHGMGRFEFFSRISNRLEFDEGCPMTCRRLPRRVQNVLWWLAEIQSNSVLSQLPSTGLDALLSNDGNDHRIACQGATLGCCDERIGNQAESALLRHWDSADTILVLAVDLAVQNRLHELLRCP